MECWPLKRQRLAKPPFKPPLKWIGSPPLLASMGALLIHDGEGLVLGTSRYYDDHGVRSVAIDYTFLRRSHWDGITFAPKGPLPSSGWKGSPCRSPILAFPRRPTASPVCRGRGGWKGALSERNVNRAKMLFLGHTLKLDTLMTPPRRNQQGEDHGD
jgi:hypothetical protein